MPQAATLKRNGSGGSGRLFVVSVAPAVKEARCDCPRFASPPGKAGMLVQDIPDSRWTTSPALHQCSDAFIVIVLKIGRRKNAYHSFPSSGTASTEPARDDRTLHAADS